MNMKKVILASKSPRRLELLNMLGFDVEVIVSDVDESNVSSNSPAHLAQRLSYLKAEAVYKEHRPDRIPVIAADTLVEVNGKILGKPQSAEDAKEMLTMLSGRPHYVHTGLSVIYCGAKISIVESAKVYFRKIYPDEIDAYIRTGQPFDKAGAYGIQGQAGAFVERIEGDYYSIMGLPISRLITILRDTMGLTFDLYHNER